MKKNIPVRQLTSVWLYLLSTLGFIIANLAFSFPSVKLPEAGQILATALVLVSTYALCVFLSGRHAVAALLLTASLALLPLVPAARYGFWAIMPLGLWVLLKHADKTLPPRFLFTLPLLFGVILSARINLDFNYHNLLDTGKIHIDAAFHAAIAAMYKNYGITSIGLNGLVPVSYHTLSHQLMAGLSTLSGLEALASYSYLYFALGPLLLTFAFASMASQLNPQLPFSQALLYTTLIILVTICIPVFTQAMFINSYYRSESYLVSLVLLLASLATLHSWSTGNARHPGWLAISLLLLIIAGLSKGSTGLVGLCVFGYFALFKYRNLSYWAILGAFSVVFYFLLVNTASKMSPHMPVEPFHFIATYVHPRQLAELTPGKLVLFFGVHYLTVWICFINGFYRSGKTYLHSFEFGVLLALLIPGIVLSQTFNIPGGSAYYFSSIAGIIAMPFLVAHHLPSPKRQWSAQTRLAVILALSGITALLGFYRHHSIEKQLAEADTAIAQNIDLLQNLRDNSAKNTLVAINNKEIMVEKIGCRSYWLFVAVAERPALDGLPDFDLCPQYTATYGILDYQHSSAAKTGFKIHQVTLNP